MEEGGVQVMILSNNRSSHRVETFCRELGIPYVGHAQKPRTTASAGLWSGPESPPPRRPCWGISC